VKVQETLVSVELSVANVKGLVVNCETKEFRVSDVNHDLIRQWVPVAAFGVGEGSKFVNAIEVGT
jgi:hypothetical protein